MSTSHVCSQSDSVRALLEETLAPEECARVEQHVQDCAICQQQLDRASSCVESLQDLGRQLGDPTATPVDQMVTAVLDRLHGMEIPDPTASTDLADLYFLRPADRPELLGMLGSYEVQEIIGQGGMGIVLKAYEPALHRLVAIKVLAPTLAACPTARRRLLREARAAAAVVHDHIVTLHAVHEADGLPYLVMQYVAGESLQDRLDREGALEITEVVRIALQTASGLAAAHAQGLVHRDIKPANLLLEDGLARVKITDFGLARSTDDVALTQNGVVPGTPEYMSPEQARGEAIDHRSDLFSLGSVLYAMCTGEPPFRGSTTVAVLRKVSDDEPPPIRTLNPAVPEWLTILIARLQGKDPADRAQTAGEVAALLEGYLAHLRRPEVPAPELVPLAHSGPVLGGNAMVNFTCAACGTKVKARAELAGKKVKCPRCASAILVPAALAPVAAKTRFPMAKAIIGAALGLVALLLCFGLFLSHGNPGQSGKDFHEDFRNKTIQDLKVIPAGFPQASQFMKCEPEGLRISVPDDPMQHRETGVSPPFDIQGDFEIVASYEILQADERGGAAVEIYFQTNSPTREALGFGRFFDANGRGGYSVFRLTTNQDGRRQTVPGIPGSSPVTATNKLGQLRITRRAGEAILSAAQGDEEFQELFRVPLGTEDVVGPRVGVNPYQARFADARLVDLRIKGNLVANSKVGEAKSLPRGTSLWLLAGLVVLVLGAAGLWTLRRKKGYLRM